MQKTSRDRPGFEGLHNRYRKANRPLLVAVKTVKNLFTQSAGKIGDFPAKLKQQKLMLILKSNKALVDPLLYRPIRQVNFSNRSSTI